MGLMLPACLPSLNFSLGTPLGTILSFLSAEARYEPRTAGCKARTQPLYHAIPSFSSTVNLARFCTLKINLYLTHGLFQTSSMGEWVKNGCSSSYAAQKGLFTPFSLLIWPYVGPGQFNCERPHF